MASSNVMLDALSETMNAGVIELLDDDQRVLATLKLSDPAAATVDGVLEFYPTSEERAVAHGTAAFARILTPSGDEVFSCDTGDEESDATIKFNTTKFRPGGPVRIDSFKLVMP
jgi:hypothetical protein